MDAKVIAKGILDGLSTIPRNFAWGVVRTWEGSGLSGSEIKNRNSIETERFIKTLRYLRDPDSRMRRMITIIIDEFYSKLDNKGKKAIEHHIEYAGASVFGRVSGQMAVSQISAMMILKNIKGGRLYRASIRSLSSAIVNAPMLQGTIEEAARAARRLNQISPIIYNKLYAEYLEMLFFLVEEPMMPYVPFIESHPLICKGVQDEICLAVSD